MEELGLEERLDVLDIERDDLESIGLKVAQVRARTCVCVCVGGKGGGHVATASDHAARRFTAPVSGVNLR